MVTQSMVRIILDFDGVLNAICWDHRRGFTPPADADWTDWETATANGFPLCWSSSVVQYFRDLSSDPRVDLYWLSTWNHIANDVLNPLLDLPPFKTIGRAPLYDHLVWWKLPHASSLWDEDEMPFVWVDDDLKYSVHARDWLKSLPSEQRLPISPQMTYGLAKQDLASIDTFIQQHTGK